MPGQLNCTSFRSIEVFFCTEGLVFLSNYADLNMLYLSTGKSYIYTIILLKTVCLSVGVHKLQVTILARLSREMSLTVRIV